MMDAELAQDADAVATRTALDANQAIGLRTLFESP